MIYQRKSRDVVAIQWKGNNLRDIEAFLESYTNRMAEELGVRNEADSYLIFGKTKHYNLLQFYAWGDDQEVDLGKWIVIEIDENNCVISDNDGGGRHIYDDWEFKATFEKKARDG